MYHWLMDLLIFHWLMLLNNISNRRLRPLHNIPSTPSQQLLTLTSPQPTPMHLYLAFKPHMLVVIRLGTIPTSVAMPIHMLLALDLWLNPMNLTVIHTMHILDIIFSYIVFPKSFHSSTISNRLWNVIWLFLMNNTTFHYTLFHLFHLIWMYTFLLFFHISLKS